MNLVLILSVCIGIVVFCLVSRRIEGTPLTLPLVFTLVGWVVGNGGLEMIRMSPDRGTIHFIAEATLILVLFSDAARINLRMLVADHGIPLRLLGLGMPLSILLGAGVILLVFPEAILPTAFLVAAILAPTDAALGASVVSNLIVPVRIRQALNVESGLNDGLALPLVLIFAIWAGAPFDHGVSALEIFEFAALQVTLGPFAGIAVGYAAAKLIDAASDRSWMTEAFQGIAIMSTAVIAFAFAELIHGNGFIAAFCGGLVFGATLRHKCAFLFEFMEGQGQLLVIATFTIFGAVMVPDALDHAVTGTIVISLLFLTVVRMLPVYLAVSGAGLSVPSKLFLGWFGPRGLASILFALLILEEHPVPGAEEVLACVVITVALSVLLHGVTAGPLARIYGKYVDNCGDCAEKQDVPEHYKKRDFAR